jgi:predicted CXXCH cytochrome family protein
MKGTRVLLFAVLVALILAGCAYRYYLGLHGPSVKAHRDIHSGFVEDEECLGCHRPGNNRNNPVTSHPQFTGCLKCHNDEPG